MKDIEYYSKNVYGEWKMYVKDAETAAKVGNLFGGQKTVTERNGTSPTWKRWDSRSRK